MRNRQFQQWVFFILMTGTVFVGCSGKITAPSSPVPSTPTFTVTSTATNTPTVLTVGPTLTSTALNSPTNTATFSATPTVSNTPVILTPTATNSPTNSPSITSTNTPTAGSPTATPSDTPTNSPTNSPTDSPTASPTITWTPTPTGTWFTPTRTFTNCYTVSPTVTGTLVPTPVTNNYISGALSYTGSGIGANIAVSGGAKIYVFPSSGTYTIGVAGPGVYYLSAYYDYGISGISLYYCPTCSFAWFVVPYPGMRYTNSGSCSNPVTVATFPVTVSGTAGTTVAGPTLSFDDTCSYWGIYGTLSYTGTKGSVQYCRGIQLRTYTDAAYTVPAPYSAGFAQANGPYSFVTNEGPGGTGLTTLYLRAYFDINGAGNLTTGDPYLNVGPVTPSADGLLQNIAFNDSYIY